MTTIRVEYAEGFHLGDDAVLVAMDGAGVDTLADAINVARRDGSAHFDNGGVRHDIAVRDGDSDIAIDETAVRWELDSATATEIADALAALSAQAGPGHHYVDITSPADTLALSRDEYLP